MKILKIVFKNAFRHKLRAVLTIFGIAIAVLAFCLLRTVVTAWYAGVESAAADRLVVRQSVSFIFPLPYSYLEKIKSLKGVTEVTHFSWFQGVYKDKNNFFARMACDPETIFKVYPEFVLTKEEQEAFLKTRNGCVIGEELAKQFHLKVGDHMPIEGDIYPGQWDFTVAAIYKKRDKNVDGSQMFFQHLYLDERMKVEAPARAGYIGWFVVKVADPNRAAELSKDIDALFANSRAETKTETERAFTQNFISASGAIFSSINFISFVIIGIIMLVLGNTMIMSARERTREYAVLKTLGFSSFHLIGMILGEALIISAVGGSLGVFLSFPLIQMVEQGIPKGMFPSFSLEPITILLAGCAALIIGVFSAIFPIQKALRTKIVDGFRFVG
ncbi:MAG: ABC transporter permease [Ignavibacteria bacterium]|nr:ABC transporter permease [Ignavibacteria bacterium]